MWNCDLFCRVVDNFGDIGICWRLARQLNREYRVPLRLWVDDLETFCRLCPAVDPLADVQTIDSIVIRRWPDPFPSVPAADVVIEAFACELPENYVAEMASRPTAPVWVNLEYLSAERWVDDCHLLPSPNPRSSLVKHFFFPGFTSSTGGLMREHDLLDRLAAFDLAAQREFWSRLGIADPPPAALRVSLFCYENPALPKLLDLWRAGPQPVCLLATCGRATEQVERWLGCQMPPGTMLQTLSLTVHALPFLPQDQYDLLLRACDLNFVRGEDSFVRAQWAQRPFIWQVYPQSEQTHLQKLDAFLARYLQQVPDAGAIRRCWEAWNEGKEIAAAWPEFLARRPLLEAHGSDWAGQLDLTGNLANNLVRFVSGKINPAA